MHLVHTPYTKFKNILFPLTDVVKARKRLVRFNSLETTNIASARIIHLICLIKLGPTNGRQIVGKVLNLQRDLTIPCDPTQIGMDLRFGGGHRHHFRIAPVLRLVLGKLTHGPAPFNHGRNLLWQSRLNRRSRCRRLWHNGCLVMRLWRAPHISCELCRIYQIKLFRCRREHTTFGAIVHGGHSAGWSFLQL